MKNSQSNNTNDKTNKNQIRRAINEIIIEHDDNVCINKIKKVNMYK